MNAIYQFLLLVHIISGFSALGFGTAVIAVPKGGRRHKKWGKLFHYSMLFTGLTALTICCLPDHASPFLFGIGILSVYFTQTGQLTVKWKSDTKVQQLYIFLSITLLIVGLSMITKFFLQPDELPLFLIFGALATVFAISDLGTFFKVHKRKAKWMQIHLSKMMGAYISALSAFLVVNQVFQPMVNWLAPGIIGGIIITVYTRKSKLHPRRFMKKTSSSS